ncbi:MAG TPA: indole-3-glycerol phosphate synthase TrpC, partial [Desulfobacteria bacterium]|nr:indole-3-glycerol phosphate synthase TrpC [Desulfobacteria bacterium]
SIVPLSKLKNMLRNRESRPFATALRDTEGISLIAEIKKASPSKGLIREDFNPAEIAKVYSEAGAAAISVLTDREFFKGEPEYLRIVSNITHLPVLRKDFIIDSYQIHEARAWGADAVLLIMAILGDREVREFLNIAKDLGLECLVEVHSEEELSRALDIGVEVVGINNRNLQTFKTDLETTFRLKEKIDDPSIAVVSESGINTRDDVERLSRHGIHAMLVGEALMRESDIARKVSELLG